MIKHYLKLIGWPYLVLLVLAQYVIKYGFLEPFAESHGVVTMLSPIQFTLLVLASVCIAAAGYITYLIHTLEAETINQPKQVIINEHISEDFALTLFVILNFVAIGLGFYLAHSVGKSNFFVIFILASALLYVYSTYLKSVAIISAITIGIVTALALLVVPFFELLPTVTKFNKETQLFFFGIILDYSILAALITTIYALVSELKAINGHYNIGMKTLPVILGKDRSNKIVFGISLLPIFAVVFYITAYLFKQTTIVIYTLAFVVAPLIYTSIKLFNAEDNSDYKLINRVLKVVLLALIISLYLYKFIIKPVTDA